MNALRTLLATAILTATVSFVAPSQAEAKLPLLRVWAEAHGTYMTGSSEWFQAADSPRLGWGGQVGVAALIFELSADVNIFDLGSDSDAPSGVVDQTMWNSLNAGVNFPFRFRDGTMRLTARGLAGYTYAPYVGLGVEKNQGFTGRAIGDFDYFFTKVLAVGVSNSIGYHLFQAGAGAENRRGVDWQTQLRFRFEFGL